MAGLQVRTGRWALRSSWLYVLTMLTCIVVASSGLQDSKKQSSLQRDIVQELDEELRILLFGKTGVGKSATGNTILRKKAFLSDVSSTSVTTECKKEDGNVNGRKVSVIDSPGLFDTNLCSEEVISRIKKCIPLSSPGPHVFVVVVKVDRFTEEENTTVNLFQTIFGEQSSRYTMILFTHGDQLKGKSIHKFVRDSPNLLHFIRKYNGRYHVFNNEDQDEQQVIQLLDQIDKMVNGNGGEHYTSEMLQVTERLIEEEKQRILKESEAQRQEEIKKLSAQLTEEMAQVAIQVYLNDQEMKARRIAEQEESLWENIKKYLKAAADKMLNIVFKSIFSCLCSSPTIYI